MPIESGFELKSKILELQESILARHPRMPMLLRDIHTTLRQQPENVTLMSEGEIAIIIQGLQSQTSTVFAQSIGKVSAVKSATKKIQQLGADAF